MVVGIAIGIAIAYALSGALVKSTGEGRDASQGLQAGADDGKEKNDALDLEEKPIEEEIIMGEKNEAACSSEGSFEETCLQRMRVDELRGRLRHRGLKVSGRKDAIIERLVSDGWKPAGRLGFQ
jgi:hypothetical protein